MKTLQRSDTPSSRLQVVHCNVSATQDAAHLDLVLANLAALLQKAGGQPAQVWAAAGLLGIKLDIVSNFITYAI